MKQNMPYVLMHKFEESYNDKLAQEIYERRIIKTDI